MKKLILIVLFVTMTACYSAKKSDDCEPLEEVDTCDIKDVCDGDDVVFYDVDNECNATEDRQFCEYGCRDAGPNEDVRCFEACEINNCPTPLPICESSIFVTIFSKSTCVVTGDGEEKCIENVATRRHCPNACFDYDDGSGAVCMGSTVPIN